MNSSERIDAMCKLARRQEYESGFVRDQRVLSSNSSHVNANQGVREDVLELLIA
jgi:hypothetical protein